MLSIGSQGLGLLALLLFTPSLHQAGKGGESSQRSLATAFRIKTSKAKSAPKVKNDSLALVGADDGPFKEYRMLQARMASGELTMVEPATISIILGVAVVVDIVNWGVSQSRLRSARRTLASVSATLEAMAEDRISTCVTLRQLHMETVLLRFQTGKFLKLATGALESQFKTYINLQTEVPMDEAANLECSSFIQSVARAAVTQPIDGMNLSLVEESPRTIFEVMDAQFQILPPETRAGLLRAWQHLQSRAHELKTQGVDVKGYLREELQDLLDGRLTCKELLQGMGQQLIEMHGDQIGRLKNIEERLLRITLKAEKVMAEAVDRACFELTTGEIMFEDEVEEMEGQVHELEDQAISDLVNIVNDFADFFCLLPAVVSEAASAKAFLEIAGLGNDAFFATGISGGTTKKLFLSASMAQHIFAAMGMRFPVFKIFCLSKSLLQGAIKQKRGISELVTSEGELNHLSFTPKVVGALEFLDVLFWMYNDGSELMGILGFGSGDVLPITVTMFAWVKLVKNVLSLVQNCMEYKQQKTLQAEHELDARLHLTAFLSEYRYGVCAKVALADVLIASSAETVREFAKDYQQISAQMPTDQIDKQRRWRIIAEHLEEFCGEVPSFCWAQLASNGLPKELLRALDPFKLDKIRHYALYGHISQIATAVTSVQGEALEALGGIALYRDVEGNMGGLFVWRGGETAITDFHMCSSDDRGHCSETYKSLFSHASQVSNVKYLRLPPPAGQPVISVKDGTHGDPYPARAVFVTKRLADVQDDDLVFFDASRSVTISHAYSVPFTSRTKLRFARELACYPGTVDLSFHDCRHPDDPIFKKGAIAWHKDISPVWDDLARQRRAPGLDVVAVQHATVQRTQDSITFSVPINYLPAGHYTTVISGQPMSVVIVTLGGLCRFLPALRALARPMLKPAPHFLWFPGYTNFFYQEAWLVHSEAEAKAVQDDLISRNVPELDNHIMADTGDVCHIKTILRLPQGGGEGVIDARACLPSYGPRAQNWCTRHLSEGFVPLVVFRRYPDGNQLTWASLNYKGKQPLKVRCHKIEENRPQLLKNKIEVLYVNPKPQKCQTDIAIMAVWSSKQQLSKVARKADTLKIADARYEAAKKNVVVQTERLMENLNEHLCSECLVAQRAAHPLQAATRRVLLQLPSQSSHDAVQVSMVANGTFSGPKPPNFQILLDRFAVSWDEMEGTGPDYLGRSFAIDLTRLGLSPVAMGAEPPPCNPLLSAALTPILHASVRRSKCTLIAYLPIKSTCVTRGGLVVAFDWSGQRPEDMEKCWSAGDHEAPIDSSGLLVSVCYLNQQQKPYREELMNLGYYPTQHSLCKVDQAPSSTRLVSQEFWVRRDPRVRVQDGQYARLNCGEPHLTGQPDPPPLTRSPTLRNGTLAALQAMSPRVSRVFARI